jgi:hypothetical protein
MPRRTIHFEWARRSGARAALTTISIVVVFGTAGCTSQRRARFRFSDVAYARPVVPAVAPGYVGAGSAPDLDIEPLAMPAHALAVHVVPAKPHVAPVPSTSAAHADKAADPGLEPELSPAELAGAKADTQRSLDNVDRTLGRTQGRLLTASQRDLAAQIRGFADTAREASRGGDWSRARTLARKAEVLSQELAGTL